MKLRTALSMARGGQLRTLVALDRALRPYYRVAFVATAAEHGLLALLAPGPAPLERIADHLGIGPRMQPGLAAWLAVGVELGELAGGPAGYRLRGALARLAAGPDRDDAAALLEEASRLHGLLLTDAPARCRDERPFTLADQDGAVIARSSRVVEPLLREAIDLALPTRGPVRLLEIGCGSGAHVRYAARRNPALTARAIELQPAVAAQARANLAAWGLAERVAVEVADVRALTAEPTFDLVTLHQNLYYFPEDERPALLAHVRGFLVPGGRLLITSATPGPTPLAAVLDLWGVMTEGCGPLPRPAALVSQLAQAGYQAPRARRLAPAFHAFLARAPGPPA
jgi:SAM-dependent methyltransferase